jgi:hypothetical protein
MAQRKGLTMPSLLEAQQAMRISLVDGDNRAITAMLAEHVSPDTINIYRNTFLLSLTKALRLTYPIVQRLVGEEFFKATAQRFVIEQPPCIPHLDQYGGAFVEFLQNFEPAAALPYLADVARLEWSISCALHAPDEKPLDPQELAVISSDDHGRVCFVGHPSIRLLKLDYPADYIWQAIMDGDDDALRSINLNDGKVRLLVERRETGVEFTRLERTRWRLAEQLLSGSSIQVALDEAGDIDASAAIAEHLASGRFTSFVLTLHETSLHSIQPES